MTEVVDAFRDELRRIFRLRPVFSVLIGAVLIYAAFYPQPYLAEALRDVPIVVVDRDGTAASREMARRIDATSDARIAFATPDLPDAERRVMAREAHGIVLVFDGSVMDEEVALDPYDHYGMEEDEFRSEWDVDNVEQMLTAIYLNKAELEAWAERVPKYAKAIMKLVNHPKARHL